MAASECENNKPVTYEEGGSNTKRPCSRNALSGAVLQQQLIMTLPASSLTLQTGQEKQGLEQQRQSQSSRIHLIIDKIWRSNNGHTLIVCWHAVSTDFYV